MAKLVEGFESPFGLELLATAYWTVAHDRALTQDEVIRDFYSWGDRKKRFSQRQIELAVKVLNSQGWLPGAGPAVGSSRK